MEMREDQGHHQQIRAFLIIILGLVIATALGFWLRSMGISETNMVVVYILSVILISRLTPGYLWGIIAAVLATAAFNYFFTSPFHSFSVDDPTYWITFFIMTATAIIISAMNVRLQESIQVEAEAKREHYRNQLLRSISHDLRTPLTGIKGTSEMILQMTERTDPRYTMVEGIHQDANWLQEMVENVLSLTRLQDDGTALVRTPEVAEEIIGSAVVLAAARAPDHIIQAEMPEEILFVPMDARLMEQVLLNLLGNAIKHTTPDQPITVTLRRSGDKAIFTVADRGEGIAPEDLPHLFEMFYTKAAGNSDSQKGIGLGLPICQAIVEAHGGTITAANSPGGGAVFTVTLPVEEKKNECL